MGRRTLLSCLIALCLVSSIASIASAAASLPAAPAPASAQTIGAGSCIGTDACTGATGNIGDNSCIGAEACMNATGNIGNGSCLGSLPSDSSCKDSSADIGDGSCTSSLGECRLATGSIGDGSCNGNGACHRSSAIVGDGSCNTGTACPDSSGQVGNSSCNDFASCIYSTANIGNNACNGKEACIHHSGGVADNTCNTDYACSTQPDLLVRLSGNKLRGNDVYNTDGSGQTCNFGPKKLADGAFRFFYVYIVHDGRSQSDSFTLQASDPLHASDPGYEVRYYTPSMTEITAQVQAGTFVTPDLDPGQRYAIRVKITVTAAAAHGSQVSRLITATSDNYSAKQDAIGINLRRK